MATATSSHDHPEKKTIVTTSSTTTESSSSSSSPPIPINTTILDLPIAASTITTATTTTTIATATTTTTATTAATTVTTTSSTDEGPSSNSSNSSDSDSSCSSSNKNKNNIHNYINHHHNNNNPNSNNSMMNNMNHNNNNNNNSMMMIQMMQLSNASNHSMVRRRSGSDGGGGGNSNSMGQQGSFHNDRNSSHHHRSHSNNHHPNHHHYYNNYFNNNHIEQENDYTSVHYDNESTTRGGGGYSGTGGNSSHRQQSTEEEAPGGHGHGGDASRRRRHDDEWKSVRRLRIAVLMTLLGATVAAITLVYYSASSSSSSSSSSSASQPESFTNAYNASALFVTEAFHRIATQHAAFVAAAVRPQYDAAAAAAANNNNNNNNNTFVTLPHYEQLITGINRLAQTMCVSIHPILSSDDRQDWYRYSKVRGPVWTKESFRYQNMIEMKTYPLYIDRNNNGTTSSSSLSYVTDDGNQTVSWWLYPNNNDNNTTTNTNQIITVPIWQTAPLLSSDVVNRNTLQYPYLFHEMNMTIYHNRNNRMIIGDFLTASTTDSSNTTALSLSSYLSSYLSTFHQQDMKYEGDIYSHIYIPIDPQQQEQTNNNQNQNYTTLPAAVIVALIQWKQYFYNLLPHDGIEITMIIENPCQGPFSYQVKGNNVIYLGKGDYHDARFNQYEIVATLNDNISSISSDPILVNDFDYVRDYCPISIRLYPTASSYDDNNMKLTPVAMTIIIAFAFLLAVFMFIWYDRVVERRQDAIWKKAMHSSQIISSLFPKSVADRIFQKTVDNNNNTNTSNNMLSSMLSSMTSNNNNNNPDATMPSPVLHRHSSIEFVARQTNNTKYRLKSFLDPNGNKFRYNSDPTGGSIDDPNDGATTDAEPIADLFPATTVLFADIAGFTAWSSSREPSQVFILLQNVYQSFDAIAKRRHVFKVETIGDSYVAVTGCPEAQEHHALIMARFANECQRKLGQVTNTLDARLGPGTSDLEMRMGMHSGPVTGGVLWGDKARFQLFGDTVNTAARMESTGLRGKIQISSSTAALLTAAGKGHWIEPREDAVNAKGKGILSTFWLCIHHGVKQHTTTRKKSMKMVEPSDATETAGSTMPSAPEGTIEATNPPVKSQNNRLTDWIYEILQTQIMKIIANRQSTSSNDIDSNDSLFHPKRMGIPLDEVVEAIQVPDFDKQKHRAIDDYRNVKLSATVSSQLRELISIIAASYNDNPFHNFEHACHVMMSVNKLLMRIVTPEIDLGDFQRSSVSVASHLHDYTYGIHSDPMIHLAIMFSAIIHDLDHRGVSNVQLGKENPTLATTYREKSIAEQNSLDLSWNVLMSEQFDDLRQVMFATTDELHRFRQVVVNAVLATDIFDKELNDLRKQRWEKAFSDLSMSPQQRKNLQATIVIEHMMQASDVSHTMQHWHVYRKWNSKLFKELYVAYRSERMASNPYDFWYRGELAFFDNYIIPLAKKLKECNVFGVSSDEYLNYAERNRTEWEARGQDVVQEMMDDIIKAHPEWDDDGESSDDET